MIRESFSKTNNDVNQQGFDGEYSGTTVCAVFIFGKQLICANLGDSRAVIGKIDFNQWVAYPLSKDHKPNAPGEKDRILKNNGRIEPFRSI